MKSIVAQSNIIRRVDDRKSSFVINRFSALRSLFTLTSRHTVLCPSVVGSNANILRVRVTFG